MVQKHMQDVAHGFWGGHDSTVLVELDRRTAAKFEGQLFVARLFDVVDVIVV